MANGKSLELRAIGPAAPTFIHRFKAKGVKARGDGRIVFYRDGLWTPYANPAKDRALAGKKRRQARKAARR